MSTKILCERIEIIWAHRDNNWTQRGWANARSCLLMASKSYRSVVDETRIEGCLVMRGFCPVTVEDKCGIPKLRITLSNYLTWLSELSNTSRLDCLWFFCANNTWLWLSENIRSLSSFKWMQIIRNAEETLALFWELFLWCKMLKTQWATLFMYLPEDFILRRCRYCWVSRKARTTSSSRPRLGAR